MKKLVLYIAILVMILIFALNAQKIFSCLMGFAEKHARLNISRILQIGDAAFVILHVKNAMELIMITVLNAI